MRELPREEYARQPERQNVRIETQAGDTMEFERIQVAADTLTGLRPLETASAYAEYDRIRLPLAEVRRMSVRQINWYRTGLIAGVAAAVTLAAVLSQSSGNAGSPGPGECGDRPCP